MRVKTVPRHRAVRNNSSAAGNTGLSFEHSDDSLISDEERKDSLKYMLDALEVTDKYQTYPLKTTLLDRGEAAGNGYYSSPPLNDYRLDNNNNYKWMENGNSIEMHPVAGPSNGRQTDHHIDEPVQSPSAINDSMTALNLSKKDCVEELEPKALLENRPPVTPVNDEKLKGSFLYKMMTDPTFLENVQKSKQPKKFTCQFCKQEFNNGNAFYKHIEVKKNASNQVICCACKKTFAQTRYLRYHQRCHSDRIKFTCDICTKKYTRLDNLTRHNVFHINPDKFACSSCEKTFARKDLLKKHQKCHDNKYRYFCKACQKFFKGPLTLENHKRIFHPNM